MSKKEQDEVRKEKLEKKKQEHRKNLSDFCESHRRAPMTRRDFLNAGLIGFSAALTLPSFSRLLIPSAMAQEVGCGADPSSTRVLPATVTLTLAGGAMLAGNYVPMDEGRQVLSSYNKLGLGNNSVPITREFNNAPFAGEGISKLITALRENTSATTREKTAFLAIPVRSRDDSNNNSFSISGLVAKAGLAGENLPNLGTRDTVTGTKNKFAMVKPPNPLRVTKFSDIEGALGGAGSGALADLSDAQRLKLFETVKGLSDQQVQKVMSDSGGRTLASLVKCALGENIKLMKRPKPSLDVRQNANVAGIWGVTGGTDQGEDDVVFGSMVIAALTGAAGHVAIDMGGYDYHNDTRTRGDRHDARAGEVIGRILETAAALNEKVYIYVNSDGACVSFISEARDAGWRSDRGSAGMAYVLAFDPAGRPKTNDFQLGHFTDGQAADDDFITGGNPELASAAVFANYLKFAGKLDLLEKVIPGVFTTAQLDQILKFG